MNNYLIEGLSGTGKSAVGVELAKRGYKTIEADEVFGCYRDSVTGLSLESGSQLDWMWNREVVDRELSGTTEPVFVCGGAMNQADFTHYFKKIFTLYVDDTTLEQRLLTRTNNDFGKHPEDLARQLEWNKGAVSYAKQRGTILIDATQPLEKVVDEILKNVA